MKKASSLLTLVSLFSSFFATQSLFAIQSETPIIPLPQKVTPSKGSVIISDRFSIIVVNSGQRTMQTAKLFADWMNSNEQISLKIGKRDKPQKRAINLILDPSSQTANEGYKLNISSRGIEIISSNESGIFYGLQSLIQLINHGKQKYGKLKLDNTNIIDFPRFKWRGLHLDVCRHFMPKEFIFKYLDLMALHKYNTFHFHLTEDQGWRIEIKRYPLLTQVGSPGGFYTQEEIKEIVKYASDRFITVVPEIEMPGHSLAALASYPYLGCQKEGYKVATTWGVFEDVLCAGRESTFDFLESVIDEVCEMFPGEYIHIGGDECPKTKWKTCPDCQKRISQEGLKDEHELQSYLITRMERYINSKGKKIIGWDEILEGGLAPNAAVMSWRGEAGGIAAAKQHHYVVMTPSSHCYLDYYQAKPEGEPLAIGGFIPLKKIFEYEPVPKGLTSKEAEYIMGAQGNVWTEYMNNPEHVEYMVYPRAAALAEVVWSNKDRKRDYSEFINRLKILAKIYDKKGVNYFKKELTEN